MSWDDMVLVGTIARPHGLRGHVVVNPETDFIEERFRAGAPLWMRRAERVERVVVQAARVQSGRPVVAFEGYDSAEAVAPLAGCELRIPEEALQPLADGAYYHHQLVGCGVETIDGRPVGRVVKVEGGAGGALLVVQGEQGDVLIPLAADICVGIDVASQRIRVDAPEGLLDLNVSRRR